MKYLQLFENFKSRDDWQIGDIVVGAVLTHCDNSNWIVPGHKYEIVGYPLLNRTYQDKAEIEIRCIKNDIIYDGYWKTKLFITEEEWELKQQSKTYNL